MHDRVHRCSRRSRAADLIEYALLAAVISLAAALSLTSVGSSLASRLGSFGKDSARSTFSDVTADAFDPPGKIVNQ